MFGNILDSVLARRQTRPTSIHMDQPLVRVLCEPEDLGVIAEQFVELEFELGLGSPEAQEEPQLTSRKDAPEPRGSGATDVSPCLRASG